MEVAPALRWWAALLPALAAFAADPPADPPIDRMEASTVRVIVQDSRGAGGTGSGFIVGDGSFVVTNHHVVEGAQAALVVGKDLKIPVVRLAADDPAKDLAVLQLKQNSGRPPVVLGLRSGVKKTQTVLAAGFPGAADDQGGIDDFLEVKFSKGIVSAFVRSQSGTMLYQIDAPINPGNSGGPLFDECGNVVGIDAMKSLRPAVVVGADGQPTQERLPYGEGVAWAIQSDELLSVLRTAGITAKVAASACGAAGDTRPSGPTTTDTSTTDPGARRDSRPAGSSLILIGAGAAILLALAVALVAVLKSRPSQPAARVQAPPPPPIGDPPMPDLRLRGVSGAHAGMEFPVSAEPITLGRDPHMSQIVFDPQDSVVSKRHCIVRMDRVSGGLIVEDCGSRNGTFLDSGERLRSGEPRLVPRYGSFYLGDRIHVFQVKA